MLCIGVGSGTVCCGPCIRLCLHPLGHAVRCCFFFVPAPPLQAPDKPTYIEIEFEKGDPVKLDGQALSPAAMLTALNKVAGDNGIGRIDIVESRFVGEHYTGLECNINTS